MRGSCFFGQGGNEGINSAHASERFIALQTAIIVWLSVSSWADSFLLSRCPTHSLHSHSHSLSSNTPALLRLPLTLPSGCYVKKVKPSEARVIKYFNRDIFSAVLAVQSVTHSLSVTPDELFPPKPSLLSTVPSSSSFNFSHSHQSPANNLYKWKILPYQLAWFLLQVVLQQLWNSSKRRSMRQRTQTSIVGYKEFIEWDVTIKNFAHYTHRSSPWMDWCVSCCFIIGKSFSHLNSEI